MVAFAVDYLTVAELLELGGRVLVHSEAVAELLEGLGFDTSECVDVVAVEVLVEVQYVGGRLDGKFIVETYTLSTYTSTVGGQGACVLKALDQSVLDGVSRLEGEVVGEGDLCIGTS